MHDHDFLPDDELERDGQRYAVLDVADIEGWILVDGPGGQSWMAPGQFVPVEPEG